MHGLGNDFIVVDVINQKFAPNPEQIRSWANRQTGIGFDQLLLVEKAESANAVFKYRIFNADGGEVEQCGNGARCFARFVREKQLTDLDLIPVETCNGLMVLEMIDASRARVNMGVPQFEPRNIPLDTDHRSEIYTLSIDDKHFQFSALAIGNPY